MEDELLKSNSVSDVCKEQVVKQSEEFESDCDMFDGLSQPLGNLLNQMTGSVQNVNEQSEEFDSDETILSDFSLELAVVKSSKTSANFCQDLATMECMSPSPNNSLDDATSDLLYPTQQGSHDNISQKQNLSGYERNCLSQVLPDEIVQESRNNLTQPKRRKRKKRSAQWGRKNRLAISLSQPVANDNRPKVSKNVTKNHCQQMEELNIIEAKFSSISILIASNNHHYIEQAHEMLRGDVKKRIDRIKFDITSSENLSSDSENNERESKEEVKVLCALRQKRLEKILAEFEEMKSKLAETKNKSHHFQLKATSEIESSQSILSSARKRHKPSQNQPKLPLKTYNSELVCVLQKTPVPEKTNSRFTNNLHKSNTHSKSRPSCSERTPSDNHKPFVNVSKRLKTTPPSCYGDHSEYDIDDSDGGSPCNATGHFNFKTLQASQKTSFPTLSTGSSGSVLTRPVEGSQIHLQPKFVFRICKDKTPTKSTNISHHTNKVKSTVTEGTTLLDFKDLFQRGLVVKGSDVLHSCIQGTNYAASVVSPGLIVSSDHDIYVTPQSWLNAVTKLTFSKDQAFSKIFYNGQSLKEIASNGKHPQKQRESFQCNKVPPTSISNVKVPVHQQDANSIRLLTTTKPGAPTQRNAAPNPVDNLCAYLLKCKFLLPSDDELFVTKNLLGPDSDSEFSGLEKFADLI